MIPGTLLYCSFYSLLNKYQGITPWFSKDPQSCNVSVFFCFRPLRPLITEVRIGFWMALGYCQTYMDTNKKVQHICSSFLLSAAKQILCLWSCQHMSKKHILKDICAKFYYGETTNIYISDTITAYSVQTIKVNHTNVPLLFYGTINAASKLL